MNMKTVKQVAWAACLSAIGSAPALAQVYYVSPDGIDAARPRKSAMALHGTVDNMARVEDWGRYELAQPQ